MAGLRVINDYRKANQLLTETAALFSAGRDDAPALVAKLIEAHKKLTRRVRELDAVACQVEADEILRGSSPTVREGVEVRTITKIFGDREADSLKHLALALIAHPGVIALLASGDADTARLVFARSPDAPGDMNALMRKACEMIDGRGGGKPEMAQGGGKNVAALEDAITTAAQSLNQT
jgi:alanyl-tRNA synthetase